MLSYPYISPSFSARARFGPANALNLREGLDIGTQRVPEVHALFVVVGPNGPGRAIGARGIRYLVDKYLEELGLKAEGISCHALRHSAAT